MTPQEAIELFKRRIRVLKQTKKPSKRSAIHAMEMAIEALEKQTPKNAELETEEGEYAIFLCPNCKRIFHNHIDEPQYCDECGQAIDWSDTE